MPDLSQRQKAESEELTASLRAKGILQGDEKATLIFNERGDVTGVDLDGMSDRHAENFARYMTALKVHDAEKPEKRGHIEEATIDDLSPVDWLDRQRERQDKAKKPRSNPDTPKAR